MPRAGSREKVLELIPEDWQQYPVLSWSQLMTLDRCSFAWYLSYHMDEHSPVTSRAMDTGSYFHRGAEHLYRSLSDDIQMSHDAWVESEIPALVATWSEEMTNIDQIVSINNAQRILQRYALQGRSGTLGSHTPVGIEEHFVILCETPRGRRFVLQCYIDLITVDEKGRTWLWDHKTSSSGKFWSPVEILMDSQLPVYQIMLLLEGINASGIVYNQVNAYDYKKMETLEAKTNQDLFRREFTYRTDLELQNIKAEFMAMADELIDVMTGIKPARRSLKKDCKYCTYNGLCLNLLKGIDQESAVELWKDQKITRSKTIIPEIGEGIVLDLS